MSSRNNEVVSHIDEDRYTELVQALLQIPSIRAQPTEIDDYLDTLLGEMGLDVDSSLHVWPSAYSENNIIVGKLEGGDGQSLILEGHYDTMDITESEWNHDPFGGEIEDGEIYGRGAVDSKGQLAAMLAAIEAIQEADVSLSGDLYLLSCPDGEFGFDSVSVVERAGVIDDAGWIVSGEPTVNLDTGSYEIATKYAGLARCEIEISTSGAHLYPPHDTNVIHEANRLVSNLNDQVLPDDDEWLGPHFEPLSIDSDPKADLPVKCTVTGLISTTPEMAFPDLEGDVEDFVADSIGEDYSYEVNFLPRWRPVDEAVDDESVAALQQATETIRGETPPTGEFILLASFANYVYSNSYLNSPAPITFGGGDHSEAHSPDEKIDLAELTETAKIYAGFAADVLTDGD